MSVPKQRHLVLRVVDLRPTHVLTIGFVFVESDYTHILFISDIDILLFRALRRV